MITKSSLTKFSNYFVEIPSTHVDLSTKMAAGGQAVLPYLAGLIFALRRWTDTGLLRPLVIFFKHTTNL